uniref:Uncharacterized protein n=1 Tax=Tanacetum cinerariifolium TaxID=118510 RepID=A0A6L2JQW7_TANCI|nr:hypothetical protein [Tanacetum cinerariifolium]
MVSSVNLPILKKGEYILWTMKMEQYLAHTDYALWKIILNGNSAIHMTKDEAAWSSIPLIMRNKPGIDNLNIDDLYNNLKVYEAVIKGSSGSSSNSQNVAFVSAERTSSTNELNAAYSVSTAIGHSSQAQGSSSYANELMFSFFANQSSSPQLDNKDLEQIDQDDLEEIDLKYQVAMLYEEEGTLPGIAEQPGTQEKGVEMIGMQEKEATDFALMAFTSNPSSSSNSNSELYAALREKELKAKLEKFETSLKNLTKLLDSQISAKVKTGLGYDSQFNEKGVLDVKEEEVTETVFDNRSSDDKNSLANDRFKKDDSIYKFKISETVTSLTIDEKNAPETSAACVEKPKEDRSSAPLIQDWDTDSDNDSVFRPEHIPAKIYFVKASESVNHVKYVKPVKTAEQTEKSKHFSSSPKVDKKRLEWENDSKFGVRFWV